MPSVGSAPVNFILNNYTTSTSGVSLSSYSGNVILLSFVDIIHGWSWMSHLSNLSLTVGTNVQIIAVIFNQYNEQELIDGIYYQQVNSDYLDAKGADSLDGSKFHILMDPTNVAKPSYIVDFIGDSATTSSTFFWSYLISIDYLIADKWESITTVHSDPISFDPDPILNPSGFDSSDFTNTETFVLQRITRLLVDPTVLSFTPAAGHLFNSTPIAQAMQIFFSKPMDNTLVTAISSYPVSGAGVTGGNASGITHNIITNKVDFTLNGAIPAGANNVPVNVDMTALQDTEGNALTGTSIINYFSDITAPAQPSNTDIIPNLGSSVVLNISTSATATITGTVEANATVEMVVDGTATGVTITANGAGTFTFSNANLQVALIAGVPDYSTAKVVKLKITDQAGFITTTTNGISYTKDTAAPSVTSFTPLNGAINIDVNENLVLAFDDVVSVVPTKNIRIIRSDGVQFASISVTDITQVLGSGTNTITIDPAGTFASLTGYYVLIDAGAFKDSAGNEYAGIAAATWNFTTKQALTLEATFVLDFSSTMNSTEMIGAVNKTRIEFLQDAVEGILAVWKANPDNSNDRVGIIHFSNDSNDIYALNLLSGLPDPLSFPVPSGCTAMGSGLSRALFNMNYSNSAADKKRCIILITDGMQNVNPFVYYQDNLVSGGEKSVLIGNITSTEYPPGAFICTSTNATLPGGAADHPFVVYNNGDGQNTKENKIPVHTIGIGNSGTNLEDMLVAISGETYDPGTTDVETISRGLHFQEDDVFPNVQDCFSSILVHLFKGSSIQVVSKFEGTLSGNIFSTNEDNTNPKFILNKSVKNLTVYLSWAGSNKLKFNIKKDGKIIRRFYAVKNGNSYSVGFIKFPFYQFKGSITFPKNLNLDGYTGIKSIPKDVLVKAEKFERDIYEKKFADKRKFVFGEYINPEGNWEITIERDRKTSGDIPYFLVVFADEKVVEFDIRQPKIIWATDKFIPFEVKVAAGKEPVEIISAEVSVTRPAIGLANVLNSVFKSLEIKSFPAVCGDVSNHERVMEKLQRNQNAMSKTNKRVINRIKMIPLNTIKSSLRGSQAKEKGFLRAEYKEAVIPGTYKINYVIKGAHKNSGTFYRTISRSLVVRAKPDERATIINSVYNEKQLLFSINITPKDKYKNLLGPGYNNFKCILNKKNQISTKNIIDNYDGSYTLNIEGIKKENIIKFRLGISIFGIKIFDDYLSKLQKSTGSKQSTPIKKEKIEKKKTIKKARPKTAKANTAGKKKKSKTMKKPSLKKPAPKKKSVVKKPDKKK